MAIIIKFGLAGGFKDFLFDEEMNQKYNNGEPMEHQIERLCPPDVVEKTKKGFFPTIWESWGKFNGINCRGKHF